MSENDIVVYGDSLATAIKNIPDEVMDDSEENLREDINPDNKMYEMRRAFWEEMVLAQNESRKMVTKRIYDGKYTKSYFYNHILKDVRKVAWMIHPLVEYNCTVQAILDRGLERLPELVNMEITVKKRRKVDGEWVEWEETCPKKALVLWQVVKDLQDRIKGTAIQRQAVIHATEPSDSKAKPELSMEAVTARLKELEGKLGEGDALDGDTTRDVSKEVARDIDEQSGRDIETTCEKRSTP